MLVAALSTGNKIGLGLVGLAFIGFALVSAFLIPRLRPEYPGRRGLPIFLTVTAALFVGMMFAVFFFGREPAEKAEAAPAAETTQVATTTAAATTTEAATTAPTTTQAAPPPPPPPAAAKPQSVSVDESEFKIALPSQSLKAGTVEFKVDNKGQLPHDLVVKGLGVNDEKTPLLNAGKSATLKVDLKSGTYELYCSVPGHKQAGMDVKVTVS